MPLVSGAPFSKADLLSAVTTLAWSSLPVLADQAVQQLFFKNVTVNPKIDRNIPGYITCAIVVLTLPKGSPARIGAPLLFLVYRFALSFWNRKPKPPTNVHKPPATASSSKAPPSVKNPAATTTPASTTTAPPKAAQELQPPPSASSPAPKPPGASPPPPASDSSVKSPAAAREAAAPPSTSTSKPPAAGPIPTFRCTPASPPRERPPLEPAKKNNEASPAKSSSGTAPPQAFQEKINRIQEQAKASMAQIDRLDREVRQNLTSIPVNVKITYLPQKETESEPKQKILPKEPEVIEAKFYINPHFLFQFPKEMVPTLQKEMKKQYSITENTSFCFVFLSRKKTEPSRFPFVYFPIEILRSIAGKKKKVVLPINTEGQVFEIEFSRAGSKEVGKCLEKLDKCKRHETIQPNAYLGSPSGMTRQDMEELSNQIQTLLTVGKCYLTPFEKK